MNDTNRTLSLTSHDEVRAKVEGVLLLLSLATPCQVRKLKQFVIKRYGMPSHSAVVTQAMEAIDSRTTLLMGAIGPRERIYIHDTLSRLLEGAPEKIEQLQKAIKQGTGEPA